MLGVGVRHVRRLVADRRIPYLKWGHLLRFDPVEIREWLEAARRPVEPERSVVPGLALVARTRVAGGRWPAEISALAEAIEPRYRAMVLFDAYCGLRLGELAGLRRGRVDLLRRLVRVSEIAVEVKGQLLFGPPKTRAGNRKVPLPRFVADQLAVHLDTYGEADPDALVLMGPDGGALRANGWRARHWRPAIRAAGLEPLRPHDLRHTAVSLWVAAGASPKQIATWAGHTSVSVVLDRYGHLFPGHEDAVLDRLEGFGRNAPTTAIAADDPGVPRGAAGFPRGERDGREPGSSRHSA